MLLFAALDSAGIPMVGGVDALLIAVSAQSPGQAYLAATYALVGSLAGSSFLFFMARKGGDVFLHKQIQKGMGKRLHSWFERYGLITIFVPALSPIPLPMKIPVFCAGALQVNFRHFLAVLLVARTIRYFGLAYLATRYGAQAFTYMQSHAWQMGGIALALAIALTVAMRFFQRRDTLAPN